MSTHQRCKSSALALSCIAAALLVLMPLSALADTEAEQVASRIKAVFLYKFCGYVQWPPEVFAAADSPLVLGVAGSDSIARELAEAVRGRQVGGRQLVVRQLDARDSINDLHLLYVAASAQLRMQPVLFQVRDRPILLVTDSEEGLAAGGIINFSVQENRVRFDISMSAARRSGLSLSAQLLSVARVVRGQSP